MIPHKSRLYRCILDLSFDINFNNIKTIKNVNSTTNKLAPQKSMANLGSVLEHFVQVLAKHEHLKLPFAFCKIDIKDGFWRMVVSAVNWWNFCYTIPPPKDTPIDDIEIVVPESLQMGWTESPPYFGAATKNSAGYHPVASNVANSITTTPTRTSHMSTSTKNDPDSSNKRTVVGARHGTTDLIKVYVDDFIIATNDINNIYLQPLARAALHGVHSIFPPPHISKHSGEDPVSIKKLSSGEGVFSFTKEILGWMFNGINYTIYLPPPKTSKIITSIKKTIKKQQISLQKFQQLVGKLKYASIGLPMGKSLLSPAYAAMQNDPPTHITITSFLKQCLQDWMT